MLLVISHTKFDPWYISFGEKTSNAIIQQGNFYSVQYSTSDMTISVLHLGFVLNNITMTSHFNKYKCTYNKRDAENISTISKLAEIEHSILSKAKFITSKMPVYRMHKVMESNNLNCFVNLTGVSTTTGISTVVPELNIIMKIAGIWETEEEFGLIFKFFVPAKGHLLEGE